MWRRIALGILVVLLISVAGFVIWASGTNPVMPEALAALQNDSAVKVTQGNWLVFEPAASTPRLGYIFYPGGKVDYRAYAAYARAVASEGYLVVIPHMPLNLAVFDVGEAGKIIQAYPQIKQWIVGGHSLGGSMAANYAAHHPDQISGLVLLASYPASSDSLASSSVKVASIYGTQDGLATMAKIDASHPLLPKDTYFVAVLGGNHGQFGDYGIQSGDGEAHISREKQRSITISATLHLLKSIIGQ